MVEVGAAEAAVAVVQSRASSELRIQSRLGVSQDSLSQKMKVNPVLGPNTRRRM